MSGIILRKAGFSRRGRICCSFESGRGKFRRGRKQRKPLTEMLLCPQECMCRAGIRQKCIWLAGIRQERICRAGILQECMRQAEIRRRWRCGWQMRFKTPSGLQ